MEILERHIEDTNWIIGIKILVIVLLSLSRKLFPYRFQMFLSLTYRNKYISLYGGDGKAFLFLFNILITLVQILVVSLFLWQIQNSQFKIDTLIYYNWSYINILLGVTGYIILKLVLQRIPLIVFSTIKTSVNTYIFEKLSYFNLSSLFLFLFSLFFLNNFEISEIYIWITLSFFFLTNTIGWIFMKHWKNLNFSNIFPYILYFCIFEITPILILIRFVLEI